LGKTWARTSLGKRGVAVHLAFDFQLRRLLSQQFSGALHLARVGVSSVPKLECESSATLGVRPKRRTSSAASSVISASLLGGRVVIDVGVADEGVRSGRIRHVHRVVIVDARARPITWSM
jgi:hypothetical protein